MGTVVARGRCSVVSGGVSPSAPFRERRRSRGPFFFPFRAHQLAVLELGDLGVASSRRKRGEGLDQRVGRFLKRPVGTVQQGLAGDGPEAGDCAGRGGGLGVRKAVRVGGKFGLRVKRARHRLSRKLDRP